MNAWKHFCTITHHRHLVRKHCFRVGLYWQGLKHDLSKYSWTEFRSGIKYYQGTRSPNSRERELIGYSLAWMHHKGRNKHHYEYWTDLNIKTKCYEPVHMPRKYFVEMVMDRISASRTYLGDKYTNQEPLNYYLKSKEKLWFVHPQTKKELEGLLRILHDHGEKKTLWYIKNVYLKKELH